MITEDARRYMADAESSLEQFQLRGNALQKDWSEKNWRTIYDVSIKFCIASQGLNMSIGGLHRRTFDDATRVMSKFVDHAEDLLAEARRNETLPPEEVLNDLLGIIDRCRIRVAELTEKRNDIELYEKKITEITDP